MDISQLIQSIVLGIIQGITEWLPISSKAMMSVVMVSFYNMRLTEAVYYAFGCTSGRCSPSRCFTEAISSDCWATCPHTRETFATRAGTTD